MFSIGARPSARSEKQRRRRELPWAQHELKCCNAAMPKCKLLAVEELEKKRKEEKAAKARGLEMAEKEERRNANNNWMEQGQGLGTP